MRILLLTHAQYITVGLPKVIEFAEALAELGNQVTLVATSKTNKFIIQEFQTNGITIVESPSLAPGKLRHGADLWDSFRRIQFLRRKKFDLIHCFASRPTVFLPALYLKSRQKIPVVYEWEDLFGKNGITLHRSGRLYYLSMGWFEAWLEEKILQFADGVIAVSQFLKNRAINLAFPENRVLHQIKGTKYADQIQPSSSPKNPDEILITYVGTIYQTELQFLFDAFEYAREHSPAGKKIELQLLGFNQKEPEKVPKNVRIFNRVPEAEYLERISQTDLFVLPLKNSEANAARYPSKFGDYLAIGKPIIITPVADLKEIVDSAKCGYIAVDDNSLSLGKAILSALNDSGNWATLGANSRKFAEENLQWQVIARQIFGFYEKLVNLSNLRFEAAEVPVRFDSLVPTGSKIAASE